MERRNEIILSQIKDGGRGIEIGPSYNPIAAKKDGYNVQIIDHLTKEELIEKYKEFDVQVDNIEEVDFVWNGMPYSVLTGNEKYYDWIIASHVIEHTPDFIGFLIECDSILKDDGVLSLAVPDKRYIFDHFRAISGISRIIDNHLRKCQKHTIGTITDFHLNTAFNGELTSWDSNATGNYHLVHSFDSARGLVDDFAASDQYVDAHAWCFTPHSFRLIIHDLHSLGYIPFKEVAFFPTQGYEFFVTLGRTGKGNSISRLDLMKLIESELSKPSRTTQRVQQIASRLKRLTNSFK